MTKLTGQIIELLKDSQAIKVLTTVDEKGIPYSVFKDSLTVLEEDNDFIAYAELIESSPTNRNMVRGIWFNKSVVIAIKRRESSYLIRGKPVECLIGGQIYKRFLQEVKREQGLQADIQAVWLIRVDEVVDQSLKAQLAEPGKEKIFLNTHLDLLKKRIADE